MKTRAYAGLLLVLGVVASCACGAERFVRADNATPESPYTNWLTAATTIQAAIDVAAAGDTVWVTNGVYNAGTAVTPGYSLLNRVVITQAITVASVEGAQSTVIEGAGTNLYGTAGAVRCVYMTKGVLEGFTLRAGATRSSGQAIEMEGGGVLLHNAAPGTMVRMCVIEGCQAWSGGGAARGMLNGCTLSGNIARFSGGGAANCVLSGGTLSGNSANSSGGGAINSVLSGCTLSGNVAMYCGGAYQSVLTNCTLAGNAALTAYGDGGGAGYSSLNKCVLTGNRAGQDGGGATMCDLQHCVVNGNVTARYGGGLNRCPALNCVVTGNTAGGAGGGTCLGYLTNCIVYGNTAPASYSPNYGSPPSGTPGGGPVTILVHCCTDPMPSTGTNNIVSMPLFVGTNDFHLMLASRCINAGTNLANLGDSTDLDGRPRIVGGTVDIGAYESDLGNETLAEAVDCLQQPWATDGPAAWIHQTGTSSDGVDAAQAGPLPDACQTWLHTEVATSGTLAFHWRTSCQALYDSLAFFVDGEPHELISGETAWQPQSVFVGPGRHTFAWVYAKGKSGSSGSDCGWVDQAVWTPGVPGATWMVETLSEHGYGAPVPALGSQPFTNGAVVDASVTSPWVLVPQAECRVCTGWTRTNILPYSGPGTNTVFVMTTDETLTWLWSTRYGLKAEAEGLGAVDQAFGWYEVGANATVTAAAEDGWRFDHWSGDLSGAALAGNRITVAMSGPRQVTAHFVLLDLAEALDTTNLVWTTGGDAPWLGQTTMSWDAVDAARSGAIGDCGMTRMETSVTGAGALSFYWRCSSEAQYDFAYFRVDGVVRMWLTGTTNAWFAERVEVGEGRHVLTWEYWKDESVASGADVCWVDQIVWTPSAPPPSHGFDLWTASHGLEGTREALFAQDRNSDGVANAFEYAFGANLTLGQPLLGIRFVAHAPVVEIPRQDTGTLAFVALSLKGCTNLSCLPCEWLLPVIPAANTNGLPQDRAWFEPQGQQPRAYFKLEAMLK